MKSQKEAQELLDKLSGLAVSSYHTVTEDRIVFITQIPESLKLVRVRLAVGIGLEDIVCTLCDRVLVHRDQLRAMLFQCIGKHLKLRVFFLQGKKDLMGTVHTSAIRHDQA